MAVSDGGGHISNHSSQLIDRRVEQSHLGCGIKHISSLLRLLAERASCTASWINRLQQEVVFSSAKKQTSVMRSCFFEDAAHT